MSEKENMEFENNELETSELEQDVTEIEPTEESATKKPAKSDSGKKSKPPEKKAKSGGRISRYFRDMRSELKKVAWPSKKQTLNNTGIVIVCVIIVGIFVWIFDGIAGQIISALLNLFGR